MAVIRTVRWFLDRPPPSRDRVPERPITRSPGKSWGGPHERPERISALVQDAPRETSLFEWKPQETINKVIFSLFVDSLFNSIF